MAINDAALITIGGLPAHPLLVHAVVVLLPMAALGGLAIAIWAPWRRRFGIAVLGLTIIGVILVPITQNAGQQLLDAEQAALPPGTPLTANLQKHVDLGEGLLPYAIAFGIAMLLLYVAGLLADRERTAVSAADSPGAATASTATARGTWRWAAVVASVLVILTSAAITVEIVRIGHSGSTAVWKGIAGT